MVTICKSAKIIISAKPVKNYSLPKRFQRVLVLQCPRLKKKVLYDLDNKGNPRWIKLLRCRERRVYSTHTFKSARKLCLNKLLHFCQGPAINGTCTSWKDHKESFALVHQTLNLLWVLWDHSQASPSAPDRTGFYWAPTMRQAIR